MKNYKKKIKNMTLEEKASLVRGETPFGTRSLPAHGIQKMLFLDGGTGMNFEQLFGEFAARGEMETNNTGGMTGSLALKHVIDYYYEPDCLTEPEKKIREWISERLYEIAGDDYVPGCFPPGILLGATWNPQIVGKIGEALGMEARHFGVNLLLGSPYVNLMRDPLNGRLFESYGEDPCLMKTLAPEIVKGVQKYGVAANVKHFAANNQETYRVGVDETISRRALEELYLPSFRACVEAGAATVMSAYNAINGVACTDNYWLLTELLREQWGFDGMVISDWGAVYHPGEAVAAGNDVAMPGPLSGEPVVEAVKNGVLTEEALDRSVERILRFYDTWGPETQKGYTKASASETDRAAYEAVLEGAVMLKNDNDIFPLKGNVLLAGKGALRFYDCGTGSAGITTNRTGSLYEELKKRMGEDRVDFVRLQDSFMEDQIRGTYDGKAEEIADGEMQTVKGTDITDGEIYKSDIHMQIDCADTVLIVVRQLGMEGNDRKNLKLPHTELTMLRRTLLLAKNRGKKTGVILNVCGPVDVSDFIGQTDGIFCVFLPGMKGAEALSDLLTGRENPSGKLSVTFPKRYEDTPTYLNFPGDGRQVIYGEDIFVGYRYYDTKKIEPMFPFGYGLSYTRFAYSNMRVSAEEFSDMVTVSLDVTNTGDTAGKEVVELYVHDLKSTLRRPQKELIAFDKVYVKAGETKEVCFTVTKEMLASYDTELGRWEAEEGYFDLIAAASAMDIRLVKRVYGKWKSAYSYSLDSSFKALYEHPEIQPMLFSLFEELKLDRGILYSNYEYTPFKTLRQILEEAGKDSVPDTFSQGLYSVRKI